MIGLLRGLISEIRLHPDADAPGGHHIELYGELGAILALGDGSNVKPCLCVGGVSETLVSGAGNRCFLSDLELVVRQRTQLVNMLRGRLAEFGITLPQGLEKATGFARDVLDGSEPDIPEIGQDVIRVLCRQLLSTDYLVRWHDLRLQAVARADRRMNLLQTIPGVGPVTASAIVATIGSGRQFRNGREFAAWLGLTPRNNSSGGKERLGRITKMGDQYLRKLLVVGMTSRAIQVKVRPDKGDPWLRKLLERKPFWLATIAMANKTARIIWAVLTREEAWSPRLACA